MIAILIILFVQDSNVIAIDLTDGEFSTDKEPPYAGKMHRNAVLEDELADVKDNSDETNGWLFSAVFDNINSQMHRLDVQFHFGFLHPENLFVGAKFWICLTLAFLENPNHLLADSQPCLKKYNLILMNY